MNLKDKVVVVTGASSGIGKELCFQLADKGAQVVMAARRLAPLLEMEDQLSKKGSMAYAVAADISRRFDVDNLVRKTIQKFGRIDVFINNAGISHANVDTLGLNELDVKATMDTNFMAGVYSVWAVVPEMEKSGGGQMVFVSSVVGKRGVQRSAIYCASKFAVQGFTEALRLELRKKKIHVLTVCPPGVDTPFFETNKRDTQRRFRLHSPVKIAGMIVSAIEHQKREVLLTIDAKLLHYANVFFPRLLDWAISKNKGA